MNVYDFDQTIFFPDSSYCFVLYCLRRYPRAVLRALPETVLLGAARLFGQADTRALKEKVFSFLPYLDNVEQIVLEFWDEKRGQLADWYLSQKREDDLIISASPDFLLRPIADELGVRLIATRMNPLTGRILGDNCHDTAKVCRFLREYPGEMVDAFYSDSLSDSPMAWFAKEAWLVKNEHERVPWPN